MRSTGLAVVLAAGALAAATGASCLLQTGGLAVGASGSSSSSAGTGGAGGAPATCHAVDCSNPACKGVSCEPTPEGWTRVAFSADPGFKCPAGYDPPMPLQEATAGPGDTCACACGAPDANPCTQGKIDWTLGVYCLQGWSGPSDGGCDPINGGAIGTNALDLWNPFGKGQLRAAAPQTVACSAITTLPSLGIAGVACSPAQAGTGCGAGESCVPPSSIASTACVLKAGAAQPCPPSFPTGHTLYAPGDVTDGRSCGPCACASLATSCSNATLTTYDDSACTQHPVSLQGDDQCDDLGAANGVNDSNNAYFRYEATPDTMACKVGAAVPVNGAVTASNPVTVCCP